MTTIETLSCAAIPIPLEVITNYLRLFDASHDSTIQLLLDAAVDFIETYTRQTFRVTQFRTELQSGWLIPAFPVITLDAIEHGDPLVELSSEDLADFEINDDKTPPKLQGDSVTLDSPVFLTWTAGHTLWRADLKLIILQNIAENFAVREATSGSPGEIAFSKNHMLALQQYCTHHDAVR